MIREQCVTAGQDHRTLVVGELHSLLQDRRREMQTEAFKKEMHRRNGIEGTHSELMRGYETPSPVRVLQFSDRNEIQNPGPLYGAARPENFPS